MANGKINVSENLSDSEIYKRKCMTDEWRRDFCDKWKKLQSLYLNGAKSGKESRKKLKIKF